MRLVPYIGKLLLACFIPHDAVADLHHIRKYGQHDDGVNNKIWLVFIFISKGRGVCFCFEVFYHNLKFKGIIDDNNIVVWCSFS